jgi:hypothetical protein
MRESGPRAGGFLRLSFELLEQIVTAADDAAEDDGAPMGFVFDETTRRSDLTLLDAGTLDTVAAIHLPDRAQRLPRQLGSGGSGRIPIRSHCPTVISHVPRRRHRPLSLPESANRDDEPVLAHAR